MQISEIIIKVIGLILAFVGLGLLLSLVGINFLGVGIGPAWFEFILGVIFLSAGIYVLRGGNISL